VISQHDRYLVTGVAGFIGSHLGEALLARGHTVIGVDALTDNYSRVRKQANLAALRGSVNFRFIQGDLGVLDLPGLLADVDVILHMAGEPGVRSSWGQQFGPYLQNNVRATQALLEAMRRTPSVRRLVYASSSSIYGDAVELPVREDATPRPMSPYGVTKLAAEHLCSLYARQFGLPVVSLRFFTVFGPRQRPDMAFARFIEALTTGAEIPVFGDGEQTRDFTYVTDVVAAVLAAGSFALGSRVGPIYNIGGGTRLSLRATIGLLEEITGRKARLRPAAIEPGDVRHTWADCAAARDDLGFKPATDLAAGLAAQVAWERGQEVFVDAAA
jgi:nucleoside-diphosphate-sugar epimerase